MTKYIKRFAEWFQIKENLDNSTSKDPSFRERELWMAYFGENLGFEMSGKNDHFHRPVIILQKFNRHLFIGVPTSTKIKKNNPFYITFEYQGKTCSALISQIRAMDAKRLHYRKGRVSPNDFDNIHSSIITMLNKK